MDHIIWHNGHQSITAALKFMSIVKFVEYCSTKYVFKLLFSYIHHPCDATIPELYILSYITAKLCKKVNVDLIIESGQITEITSWRGSKMC